MTMSDTSSRFPMGPLTPDETAAWVDQLAQEMLLTAQAFRRLQVAWSNTFVSTVPDE